MADISNNYKRGFFERPSDDVDPDYKQNSSQWSKSFVEHIYSNYCKGNCAITPDDVARFAINLSYARGRQDTNLYKDLILDEFQSDTTSPQYQDGGDTKNPPKNKSSRDGFVNINFHDTMSPMPKYMNTIIGIMEGQEHMVNINAIDEKSGDLREDIKFKRFAQGALKSKLDAFMKAMEIETGEDQVIYPASVDELGMFEQMGEFKLTYEIGLQRALEHTLKASNDKKIKRAIIKDILTYGITATMDTFDYALGEVRTRHLDVNNLIIESSREEDFSDVSYWGIIEYITVADLKHETEMTDDDLYGLAGNYVGVYGNRSSYDKTVDELGFYDFYKCRIPVLVAYWLSNDSKYFTTRKLDDGMEEEFPEPYRKRSNGTSRKPRVFNNDKKLTTKETTQVLYGAKWILGSDVIYDFGRTHDVAFDYSGRKPVTPIQVYKIDEKPPVENCKPMLDQIALTFYRLQNGIANSPPPGLAIEYGSLMGMTMEDDEKWKPMDSLRLYSQKGHIIWNATPEGVEFPPTNHKPIEQLKGGLGTVVNDAAMSFELAYQQLMEITGIDRLSSNSQSPSGEPGKFVTPVAVSATNNTLRSVYAGYLSMKEQMAKSITLRVQAAVLSYDDTPYKRIIGDAAVIALKSAGFDPPIAFGIHMVAAPDDALKSEIRNAAMNALAGGKNGVPALMYSEYLYLIEQLINTFAGISYARIYIAKKEVEADQAAKQSAAATQQQMSDNTIQQNKLKAQDEIQKREDETQKELAIIEAQKQADLEKMQRKFEYDYRLKELDKQNENKLVTSN
jgi:hypothetical protein